MEKRQSTIDNFFNKNPKKRSVEPGVAVGSFTSTASSSSKSPEHPEHRRDERAISSETRPEPEDTISDSDGPESELHVKKKARKQMFAVSWLQEPTFKGWLEPLENDKLKAKCKACNQIMGAKKSDLVNHSKSKRHVTNVKAIANVETLDNTFQSQEACDLEKRQIFACLRYSLLVVSHYISFRSIDHITAVSKLCFKDPALSNSFKLKRSKCISIIKHVLAPVINDEIILEINNNPFSVLLDESTDISNTRLLCILVRYIQKNSIKTHLLDIIKIEADEGTAKGLYSLFKKCLASKNVKVSNIVGYCSDNASVMMGNNESFKSYLLKDNPNVIVNGCICHSAHLVAVAAAENIPSNVETLLHNLYSYFSRSPKRQSVLEELQEYFNKSKLKILGPSRTRWLALSKCVDRVLVQWDILLNLFRLAAVEDKNPVANVILNELQNPFVKAYLMFFKFVLPIFNQFNAIFQSEKVMINVISTESERFVRQLCTNFVRPEYFKNEKLYDLNPNDPHCLLPIEQVNVGPHTMDIIKHCNKTTIEQFKLKCVTFYQKSLQESLKRFPIKDNFFSELKFLSPVDVLNNRVLISDAFYDSVLKKFALHIESEAAMLELKKLSIYFNDDEKEEILSTNSNVIEFWSFVKNLKNFNDEYLFPNIGKLALIILTLPHGNADVERTFSYMLDYKTKKRNRIIPSTLSALLTIKLDLQSKKQCCLSYNFNKNHLRKYKNNLYNINREDEIEEEDIISDSE